MRIRTRITSVLLTLILIASGNGVLAQTQYQQIERDALFSFTDSFNTQATSTTTNGQGVRLDSNWRSKTADEGNMGTSNTAAFGFADGTMQLMTETGAAAFKPTTSNQGNVPAIVFQGSREGLLADQTIKVKAAKTHTSDMWGVRFMVHNNGQNYYVLWFGGQYSYRLTEGGKLSWGLYKCSNGTVTLLQEQAQTQNTNDVTDGYMGTGTADLTITMTDGNIAWSLDYAKGDNSFTWGSTYTDKNPFQLSGNDATVWLCAAGAGTTANNRYIKFDDFSLENSIPYITSPEPENVMYINPMEQGTISEDTVDLGKALAIRRLYYDGNLSSADILVSKDNQNYYKLTDLNAFSDGMWKNTLTGNQYRYVRSEALSDLKILTEAEAITLPYDADAVTVYPRVGGEDCFETATLSSGNARIVNPSGNTLIPQGVGVATVTATKGEKQTALDVTVTKNLFIHETDLTGASDGLVYGSGVSLDNDWRSKTNVEGPMGCQGEDNPAGFGYKSSALYVQSRGSLPGNSGGRYSEQRDSIPALVYQGEHSALSNDQIIRMKINKTNGTVGSGIRFMTHNNGNNYYALWFPGMYTLCDTDNKQSWTLYKCEGGALTVVDGKDRTAGGTSDQNVEGGFLSTATLDLTIVFKDGTISWTGDVYSKGGDFLYTWSGEYEDSAPFQVSGGESTVWLMSGTYDGAQDRGTRFYDISIADYEKYVSVDEPDAIVYYDAADGKTASNGILDLGEAKQLCRVQVGNVEEPANVWISQDGTRYYWLGELLADGDLFNDKYSGKFRYIKVEGAGNFEVKVLCETEGVLTYTVNDSFRLYPYLDGALQTATWTVNSTCLKEENGILSANSAAKNVLLTAAIDDKTIPVYVDINLIDAVAAYDGQTVNVYADALKNTIAWLTVGFYADDYSFIQKQSDSVSFDENGNASISAQKPDRFAYAQVFVWKNQTDMVPLAAVKTLEP